MSDNDPYAKYAVSQPKEESDPYSKYAQSSLNKTYPTGNKDYRASLQFGDVPNSSSQNQQTTPVSRGFFYPGGLNQSLASNPNLQSATQTLAPAGAAGLGIMQGAYNTGKSVADLPVSLVNKLAGTNINIPSPNLQQYAPQDPYSRAAFSGGELGGELGAGGGVYSGIGKALKLGAETPMIQRMLQGATTGYATGEESPGGRGVSAALGGGLAGAGQLTNKALAQRLGAIKGREESTASQGYKDLFNQVKDRGLAEAPLKKPNVDFDELKGSLLSKYKRGVDRFQDNPTIENAHQLQSDLGGMMRDIKKKSPEVTSGQREAYADIKDAQKRIRGSMYSHLNNSGNRDLANQYQQLTNNFRENVIPYRTKALEGYSKGEVKPSSLVRKTLGNEKFMLDKGNKINELRMRDALNKMFGSKFVKYPLEGALLGAGGYGIYDTLKR